MSEYIYDPVISSLEEYLGGLLDVPARGTLPTNLPPKFVQLTAVGGSEGVVTQHPMVTFVCWDVSRAKAERFASEVMAHMRACRELNRLPVYRVRTIGLPVYRPDENGQHKAQFTLELRVRGRNFNPA